MYNIENKIKPSLKSNKLHSKLIKLKQLRIASHFCDDFYFISFLFFGKKKKKKRKYSRMKEFEVIQGTLAQNSVVSAELHSSFLPFLHYIQKTTLGFRGKHN